jgi:predicted amidophosphoribosyltransferase
MRNRHIPRVCRNCQAPMAGDKDTCWRCGVEWASEQRPRTTLRLISGEARLDTERWTNERGSAAPEPAASLHATAAR